MTDTTPAVSPLPPLDLGGVRERAEIVLGWASDVAKYGGERNMDCFQSAAERSQRDVPALLSYIDALLARALTPEEAEECIQWDAQVEAAFGTGKAEVTPLLKKLGQIAGDR
jgi:hypothetical protein